MTPEAHLQALTRVKIAADKAAPKARYRWTGWTNSEAGGSIRGRFHVGWIDSYKTKKLLGTSASLLVTSALLVVTRS